MCLDQINSAVHAAVKIHGNIGLDVTKILYRGARVVKLNENSGFNRKSSNKKNRRILTF